MVEQVPRPLRLVIVRLLGRAFLELGGGAELALVTAHLSTDAWLIGLGGGLLAVVVLAVATLSAARVGINEAREAQARPPQVPALHRYYLDVLLLAIIGLIWWQIQSRGSFLVQPLGGQGLEIDYSLLLGPLLGLLALGLIVLRLFPLAVRLLARLTEPVGGSWLVHGLRHISRDPIVPGVLVVLLMLATALGLVGSVLSASLERSQEDRGLYEAGADLRVQHSGISRSLPPGEISRRIGEISGVESSAEAQRSSGGITTTGFSTSSTVLAVDSKNLAEVAWFRPDLGNGKSLEELAVSISPKQGTGSGSAAAWMESDGLTLPEDTTSLSIWARPSTTNAALTLAARLRDSRGNFFDVPFGNLGDSDWRLYQATVLPPAALGRRTPLEFDVTSGLLKNRILRGNFSMN